MLFLLLITNNVDTIHLLILESAALAHLLSVEVVVICSHILQLFLEWWLRSRRIKLSVDLINARTYV